MSPAAATPRKQKSQGARLAGFKCIPGDQGLPGRRQPQGFPLGVHPLTSSGKLGWVDGRSQRLPPSGSKLALLLPLLGVLLMLKVLLLPHDIAY